MARCNCENNGCALDHDAAQCKVVADGTEVMMDIGIICLRCARNTPIEYMVTIAGRPAEEARNQPALADHNREAIHDQQTKLYFRSLGIHRATSADIRRQQNLMPKPHEVSTGEDSYYLEWAFPRGTSDRAIREEIERQGFEIDPYHHTHEGDCCGRQFHRGLVIEGQLKKSKRAHIAFGRCV